MANEAIKDDIYGEHVKTSFSSTTIWDVPKPHYCHACSRREGNNTCPLLGEITDKTVKLCKSVGYRAVRYSERTVRDSSDWKIRQKVGY